MQRYYPQVKSGMYPSDTGNFVTYADALLLEKRAKELEAVTWIKCSERMPEPETLVLFYTESKSYFIGDCDPVTGWWTKAGKSMTGVIYWLPLSPPEDK